MRDPETEVGAARKGGSTAPCGNPLKPLKPERFPTGETLAVTFSGGGFRATLAGLGVLRGLADAGLLERVRYTSSVSGGSITNGLLAVRWKALTARGWTAAAVDELLVDPAIESISSSSMKREILTHLWRAIGRPTRTDVLAEALDGRFFHGVHLADLPTDARFVINGANLTTGTRFTFEQGIVGDYVTGYARTADTGLSLATAVAASCAVPGAFAPLELRAGMFPCGSKGAPRVTDGGAYDNSGLEVFDSAGYQDLFLVCANAGGVLHLGGARGLPIIKDLQRANSLLYRQSTALRTRLAVGQFRSTQPDRRRGVLFGLGTISDGPGAAAWRAAHPEVRMWKGKDLSDVPTVFDRLDQGLCHHLVHRGWWLTGAALHEFHPQLAPPLGVRAPALGGS